jgi:hypothetical protein
VIGSNLRWPFHTAAMQIPAWHVIAYLVMAIGLLLLAYAAFADVPPP